ncbi:MAG: putative arginyl-tRNA--protein transferase [Planctomycetota bacterium]|nr:MAG: putative arginyl-tRNA--protein transferase [Planctomycetota bacterium]
MAQQGEESIPHPGCVEADPPGGWAPCPYLPDRASRLVGQQLAPELTLLPSAYDQLLSLNHRRSGRLIYRPHCPGCQACRSLRVPTATFLPSRSQRRVLRRNADVKVDVRPPQPTREAYALYERYLAHQHDGRMSDGPEAFIAFLYDSPTDTVEIQYRVGSNLVAVSLADRVPSGLSSVYVFFDPGHARRSPGTFTALWEIEHCRRVGLAYYYLGYYVAGSAKMTYKAAFRPCEILDAEGVWRSFDPAVPPVAGLRPAAPSQNQPSRV